MRELLCAVALIRTLALILARLDPDDDYYKAMMTVRADELRPILYCTKKSKNTMALARKSWEYLKDIG